MFAIGNPGGLSHTLTTGVVSGLNRAIPSPGGTLTGGAIQVFIPALAPSSWPYIHLSPLCTSKAGQRQPRLAGPCCTCETPDMVCVVNHAISLPRRHVDRQRHSDAWLHSDLAHVCSCFLFYSTVFVGRGTGVPCIPGVPLLPRCQLRLARQQQLRPSSQLAYCASFLRLPRDWALAPVIGFASSCM